jgi:iron complex outermembrane receptor protein
MVRWERTFSARSEMDLRVFYDRNHYDNLIVGEHVNTFDLDFQHRLGAGGRHDVIWGFGYRYADESFDNSFSVSFKPETIRKDLFSAFAQDEITALKDRLRLTLGVKFEHHEYTGLEVQPSARLLWTPHARHTAWAAVSRAVRTPSDVQQGIQIPIAVFPGRGGSVSVLTLLGDPKTRSEDLLACESGYRLQPHPRLSLDAAAFYNVYDHLSSADQGAPFREESPAPPHTVIPLRFGNLMYGRTYGAEVVANWNATDRWRLTTGYSGLRMRLHHRLPEGEAGAKAVEGNSPKHQIQIRSSLNLPRQVEFDAAMYSVGGLPTQKVPSYTRLDLRLGWRPVEALGLSVAVQNLLEDRRPEYGTGEGVTATQVERSAYGKITWGF